MTALAKQLIEEQHRIEPKHKGAVNELRATAWLIGLGYEVCRNVSQHGPVDLVAIRGDEVVLVDVKATQVRQRDGTMRLYRRITPMQEWLDVRILLVSEDSVFWGPTDIEQKPPPSWELGEG